jgi:hypothetical protein
MVNGEWWTQASSYPLPFTLSPFPHTLTPLSYLWRMSIGKVGNIMEV